MKRKQPTVTAEQARDFIGRFKAYCFWMLETGLTMSTLTHIQEKIYEWKLQASKIDKRITVSHKLNKQQEHGLRLQADAFRECAMAIQEIINKQPFPPTRSSL